MMRVLVLSSFILVLVLPFAIAADRIDPHLIPTDAQTILEKAESFELFSLEPMMPKEAPQEHFHGWKILGKMPIDKAELRATLVELFKQSVAEYKGGPARCFKPRHGIRVKHDGKAADFVICFECYQVLVYVDGQPHGGFLISRTPSDLLNKHLKDAGVELPVTPKD